MKSYPIVEVLWDDAHYEDWDEDEGGEGHSSLRCRAHGELLFQNDKVIVLGINATEEKVTSDRFVIPKGCVTRVRRMGWSTALE